jgi:biopolymer transport protein ExbB
VIAPFQPQELIGQVTSIGTSVVQAGLNLLGTIASVAPLLGLLGTVIGMVEIFGSQSPTGGNPAALAHGISVALYNTAFGLIVAIPSMIFYRFFRGRVDAYLVEMEQQAVRLVEIAHGERK